VRESALTSAALRVFDVLQWTGLASADFVRAADGGFHFLEVNPRPWGSIAAAADAQVDLFTPLADLMCGGTPAPDLAYTRDVETRILPLYLLNPRSWLDIRTAVHIITDLRSRQGAMFRSPGLALHVLHRLLSVRANWPPAGLSSKRNQSRRARRDWRDAE
jgi:predicted ATP-grasp superfamily ATP-dependent carboligase